MCQKNEGGKESAIIQYGIEVVDIIKISTKIKACIIASLYFLFLYLVIKSKYVTIIPSLF